MNNKIEYVADGNACEFVFTFPFFTTKDIVVSRNGKEITSGFTITASENAENADVPFVGGTIRFLNAPAKSEIITICRKISLNRIIDYQPTTRIDSETLNQDFNFTVEVLKDFAENLTEFKEKYNQVTNLPSVKTFNDAVGKLYDAQEIEKSLQKKASVDVDNLSASGRANVAGLIMPGNKYIDLATDSAATYLATGVAPANGYLCVRIMQGASGKYLLIKNSTINQEITADTVRGSGYAALTMPIAKGHSYVFQTNCTGEVQMCRFYYSQGEI